MSSMQKHKTIKLWQDHGLGIQSARLPMIDVCSREARTQTRNLAGHQWQVDKFQKKKSKRKKDVSENSSSLWAKESLVKLRSGTTILSHLWSKRMSPNTSSKTKKNPKKKIEKTKKVSQNPRPQRVISLMTSVSSS